MSEWWTDEDGTMHEYYRAIVLVGGDFLGEFTFDSGAWNCFKYRRAGYAYYCGDCGDIWARIVCYNSSGQQLHLKPEIVSCEKHYDQWNIAGSLVRFFEEELLQLLPEAAVRREFNLLIQKFEKELI